MSNFLTSRYSSWSCLLYTSVLSRVLTRDFIWHELSVVLEVYQNRTDSVKIVLNILKFYLCIFDGMTQWNSSHFTDVHSWCCPVGSSQGRVRSSWLYTVEAQSIWLWRRNLVSNNRYIYTWSHTSQHPSSQCSPPFLTVEHRRITLFQWCRVICTRI